MKNLAIGCEWVWPKEKFLTRKIDITEMMDDFNDDGKINRDKFKVLVLFLNDSFFLICNLIILYLFRNTIRSLRTPTRRIK